MAAAETLAKTVPCPKCNADMELAAVTPHAVATQLARHTYLCRGCNQTKTYVLPADPALAADAELHETSGGMPAEPSAHERRRAEREVLNAPGTIYDKDGNFLLPCLIRDLSKSGARVELLKEATLPQYFLLSLLPDGSGRRLCSKVWQIALIAGVRFVERGRG